MNTPSIGSIFSAPTFIAFAGDWHANTAWALKCVQEAKHYGATVIVHTGDFGYDYADTFVHKLEEDLAGAGILLMFVRGNHDDPDYLDAHAANDEGFKPITEHIWYIPQAHRWEWDGIRFLGLGGAHSVDRHRRQPGISWWPRETMSLVDMYEAVWGGPTDVMITHDCPTEVDIPVLARAARWDPREIALSERHRQHLSEVVDRVKPGLLIHGHYHVRHRATRPARATRRACTVIGLDRDKSTLNNNLIIMDLSDIRERYCETD